MAEKLRRQHLVLLAVLGLGLTGCGGLFEEGGDVQLGIPYRSQEQFNYCVPASVLMWRLYDGLPSVSQTSIYNWLGGSACSPLDVPAAVNHFTATNDAILDLIQLPTQTAVNEMVARQITSINAWSPVIPIVNPARNHVGIINGGKYHTTSNGDYVWDFVYFHDPDPSRGANDYYTASAWLDEFCRPSYPYCGQILSSAATSGWHPYYSTFGSRVQIFGSGVGIDHQQQ